MRVETYKLRQAVATLINNNYELFRSNSVKHTMEKITSITSKLQLVFFNNNVRYELTTG